MKPTASIWRPVWDLENSTNRFVLRKQCFDPGFWFISHTRCELDRVTIEMRHINIFTHEPLWVVTHTAWLVVSYSLYRAARFATSKEFWVFSVPSITLGHLLWLVHFNPLCFCVSRFAACHRPVSRCFGQWSTSFLRSFLWSFLFLSFARIKQCLPPALNNYSTHHRNFLRYSWAAVYGHSQFCFCGPSWASALHCDLH